MNENKKNLENTLSLFEEHISSADVVSAMLLGQISAVITQCRINLQMTQKEFAKYLNVSQGMVSRWEGGDCNFTVKTLAELAEKLNLDLEIKLTSPKASKTRKGNVVRVPALDTARYE